MLSTIGTRELGIFVWNIHAFFFYVKQIDFCFVCRVRDCDMRTNERNIFLAFTNNILSYEYVAVSFFLHIQFFFFRFYFEHSIDEHIFLAHSL